MMAHGVGQLTFDTLVDGGWVLLRQGGDQGRKQLILRWLKAW